MQIWATFTPVSVLIQICSTVDLYTEISRRVVYFEDLKIGCASRAHQINDLHNHLKWRLVPIDKRFQYASRGTVWRLDLCQSKGIYHVIATQNINQYMFNPSIRTLKKLHNLSVQWYSSPQQAFTIITNK
jgi:hypothetical protein